MRRAWIQPCKQPAPLANTELRVRRHADGNNGRATSHVVVQSRDLGREDQRVGPLTWCQEDQPAEDGDRGVVPLPVVLGGAEVGEGSRVLRVAEPGHQRRCENAAQQARRSVEVEILVGADGPSHQLARRATPRVLCTERSGKQQYQHYDSHAHWASFSSVMFVILTVPPAITSTHASCVLNPSRTKSR